MIRTLLPYLLTALLAVILRDLECYVAANIFCWRKRRQTQREAQKNRELQQLAAELVAKEKEEEEQRKQARKEKLMASVPYPRLLHGPLVVNIESDRDYLLIVKCMHANLIAQGKTVVNANFEEN